MTCTIKWKSVLSNKKQLRGSLIRLERPAESSQVASPAQTLTIIAIISCIKLLRSLSSSRSTSLKKLWQSTRTQNPTQAPVQSSSNSNFKKTRRMGVRALASPPPSMMRRSKTPEFRTFWSNSQKIDIWKMKRRNLRPCVPSFSSNNHVWVRSVVVVMLVL